MTSCLAAFFTLTLYSAPLFQQNLPLVNPLAVAGTPLLGQIGDHLDLMIYGGRPLERVVDCLQAKYGWRITYEDLLVLYPGDIVDVSPMYRRQPSAPPLLAARFGRIDMKQVLPSVLRASDDPAVLLQRAIDLHHAAGNVGEFRVLRSGEVFHVIPARMKDENGRLVDAVPLLDTLITIPERERSAGETVAAIAEAVGLSTAVTVKSNPMFMRHEGDKVVFGAFNEQARAALLRLLDMTGNQSSSWSLLCQAGQRLCALNVYYIQVEVEGPDGKKKRMPLFK